MFEAAFPVFQTYLLPTIPFRRRRHSSTTSASSTASSNATTDSSPQPVLRHDEIASSELHPPQPYLSSSVSSISCSRCHADLALTSQIVSKGFTGRHGRAYLVAPNVAPNRSIATGTLPNTHTHKPVPRHLVTGLHTVCDVSCAVCSSVIGWKYVSAEEEAQRYKVGKFILESRRTIVGSCWESEGGRSDPNVAVLREGDLMFDSEDEEECEMLFAGVWTPQRARTRRLRRLTSR